MATSRDLAQKIGGGNGAKTPSEIAKQLNDRLGKPLDISRTKTPLRDSGTVLPSIKRNK